MVIFAILVIGGFVLYVMTPAERARLLGAVLSALGYARHAAGQTLLKTDPFQEALRQRTRWPVITPAIVALNALVFAGILLSQGSISDVETLVAWGGNFGPRTTNGEWWRLLATTFVHAGMFHLLVNMVGLVQVGVVLERLVGHFAFAAVYVSAGILGSIAGLSDGPMAVGVGASGSIFGVYGLLIASLIWGTLRRSAATIPLATLKTLGPAAAVFILYGAASNHVAGSAEITGFAAGFVFGLALSRDLGHRKPSARLAMGAVAATVLVAAIGTVALRGIADVRPEIERIVALEDRTAAIYQKAVDQFRLGAINAKALAQLIDRAILPEVRAARARLTAIDGVPREHEALVASADEYLRLRDESWRLRSDALHKANMPALRTADRTEHASLAALERIRSANHP